MVELILLGAVIFRIYGFAIKPSYGPGMLSGDCQLLACMLGHSKQRIVVLYSI
jgi:hypothetical protein